MWNNLLQQKHTFVIYNNDGKIKILEKLINWKAVTLEMTPYAVVGISFSKQDSGNDYITVGRTGILNLSNNYNIEDLHFLGKRMVKAPKEKQPYLDEWEFVYDISAEAALSNNQNVLEELTWQNIDGQSTSIPVNIDPFTTQDGQDAYQINRYWNNYRLTTEYIDNYSSNLSEIKNPKYNTVYAIQNGSNYKFYIYYIDGAWYEIEFWNNNDEVILAKVPIHGILTYQEQIVRDTY